MARVNGIDYIISLKIWPRSNASHKFRELAENTDGEKPLCSKYLEKLNIKRRNIGAADCLLNEIAEAISAENKWRAVCG